MYLAMTFFLFISLWVVSSCSNRCGSRCCTGYIWNETTGDCTACPDGFFGKNCATMCPETYFGPDCRYKCNCTTDKCHHITGCSQFSLQDKTKTIMLPPQNTPASTVKSSSFKELNEKTPSNVSTDHYTCKRKKTKHPGNSWFDKYNVVVCLMIVAAVLFGSYLVLILYTKKEFAKQSLQTNSTIYENA